MCSGFQSFTVQSISVFRFIKRGFYESGPSFGGAYRKDGSISGSIYVSPLFTKTTNSLCAIFFTLSGSRLRSKQLWLSQRVQSTYMVQSMVSVVVISLMVWVSIPHMSTWDPLGITKVPWFSNPLLRGCDWF